MELIRCQRINDGPEAFAGIRAGKNWMLLLLLVTLLINLGTAVAVRYWPTLDGSECFRTELAGLRAQATPARPTRRPHPATTRPARPTTRPARPATRSARPATPPAGPATPPGPSGPASAASEHFYWILGSALPIVRTAGLIGALLLSAYLLVAIIVALAGGLAGTGLLAGAFSWSLLLTAMFVPWNLTFGGVVVPGVLFDRHELIVGTAEVAWGAGEIDWATAVLYYARFAGYQVLAILLWLLVQLKFAAAVRRMTVPVEQQ